LRGARWQAPLALRRHVCAAATGTATAADNASSSAPPWPAHWGSAGGTPPPQTEEFLAREAAGKLFHPSYNRAARKERLMQALERARHGEPFVVEQAAPREMPGPVYAVMTTLREAGEPLDSRALYAAVDARWPGVVKSLNHLKRNILQVALVNRVMRVRHNGSRHKRFWSLRREGQIRMTIARRKQRRSKAVLHSDPRRDKLGNKVHPKKRWPPGKWFVPPPTKKKREKAAPVYRPLPGQEGYVEG